MRQNCHMDRNDTTMAPNNPPGRALAFARGAPGPSSQNHRGRAIQRGPDALVHELATRWHGPCNPSDTNAEIVPTQ